MTTTRTSTNASPLPTVDGRGLSPAEAAAVRAAVHRAVLSAGERTGGGFVTLTDAARAAGLVAGRAALTAVLALRPRPETRGPWFFSAPEPLSVSALTTVLIVNP